RACPFVARNDEQGLTQADAPDVQTVPAQVNDTRIDRYAVGRHVHVLPRPAIGLVNADVPDVDLAQINIGFLFLGGGWRRGRQRIKDELVIPGGVPRAPVEFYDGIPQAHIIEDGLVPEKEEIGYVYS